jgi:CheY-like chemotaxis protein/anti-sigma regulatory factor (Ser/Thr protein kinase)
MLLVATPALLLRRRRNATEASPDPRLAAALEALPEAFALWDEKDRLVACNARFRTLMQTGPAGGVSLGMNRAELAEALRLPAPCGRGGTRMAVAAPSPGARPPSGGPMLVAAETPLPCGGRVGLYRDGSAKADAGQAMRVLSDLSHELRMPLEGLREVADALQQDATLDATQREQARALAAATGQLLAVADERRELGALEAGAVELRPEPVAPADLIAEALARATPHAAMWGVHLVQRCTNLPALARLDAVRLRQVLLTLLDNAVRSAPEGSEVRLEATGSGGRLSVRVVDQGPGVPPQARPGLFQDSSWHAPSGRPGLAISARLVALMGGTFGCESEAPRGGAFRFEIPLPEATPRDEASQAATRPSPRPALQRLRILAVDDSPANLSVLRALLSTTGFLLETAPDASTALGALAAASRDGQPFDLVLMDVMMPGMDGLEATRRIRAWPGVEATVPVIAVTASAFPEDVIACEAAGMNGHVPKPVERMALLRAIARVVDAAAEERAAEGDGLAALRPLFLAELAARLAALASGTAPAIETVHAIAGTIGHLGEADLVDTARAALKALRQEAPDAPEQVEALARSIAARFPGLDTLPSADAA